MPGFLQPRSFFPWTSSTVTKSFIESTLFFILSLKPENIIIDQSGYIKLTDFGLSKILGDEQKAQTICGTPEYLAPEVIKKEGHGIEVDWWCLGCLINEMVTGFPPYVHDNRMKLFELIVSAEPKFGQVTLVLNSDFFKFEGFAQKTFDKGS